MFRFKVNAKCSEKKIPVLIDVDECLTRPCGQNCDNVYGSYRCYCHTGYQLSDTDGMTCQGRADCQGLWFLSIWWRQLLLSASWQMLTSAHCPLAITHVPTAAPMCRAVTTAPAPLLVTSWHPMGKRAWVCGQVIVSLFKLRHIVSPFPFLCISDIDECAAGIHTCSASESCFNIEGGFRCLSFSCPANFHEVARGWVQISVLC